MHFFGYTNALSAYDISTIGYGCLRETSNVGRMTFISFKDVFTLSLIIQEIVATIMEVDSEVAFKQCFYARK